MIYNPVSFCPQAWALHYHVMLKPLKIHQPKMDENLVMVSFYPHTTENSEAQRYQ